MSWPDSAQRLSASKIKSRSAVANILAIDKCSTPFGIEDKITSGAVHQVNAAS